mgnify:CR=1 FL=1
MNRYRRFVRSFSVAMERAGRARVLSFLRSIDPERLEELGYAPELIARGVNAWPWRLEDLNQTTANAASEAESAGFSGAAVAEFVIEARSTAERGGIGQREKHDIAA